MNKHIIENGAVKAFNDVDIVGSPVQRNSPVMDLSPSPSEILVAVQVNSGLLETILLRLDKLIGADPK